MSNKTIAPQVGDWISDKDLSDGEPFQIEPRHVPYYDTYPCEGIPITADRLERACGLGGFQNGNLKIEPMPGLLIWYNMLYGIQVEFDEIGKDNAFRTFPHIKYIHQLQQLFRGLGLPDPVVNPDELKV